MAIQSFRDIIAWQKAHKLAIVVYKLTDKFPKIEIFGLVSQLRRNAVSVPSNIVEGYKRKSKNDAVRFYVIGESSLEEMKYQLILSLDLGYINQKEYDDANKLAEEVGKLLNAWKNNQK
jgi:four helix bundle protein